jgi:hypothetical protein
MNFTITFSREELQELPEKHRLDAITRAVEQFHYAVISAAKAGKKNYLVDMKHMPINQSGVRTFPPEYIPTADDMIQGFKIKFPGCDVSYTEVWEETKPGVKTQKKGILIDWS